MKLFHHVSRKNKEIIMGHDSSSMQGLAFALDPAQYGGLADYLTWWSRMALRVSGTAIWFHQKYWSA